MIPLPGEQDDTPRWLRVTAVVICTALSVTLVFFYARMGLDRMEEACPEGETGWSWWPPGFTCTQPDGDQERSLWV